MIKTVLAITLFMGSIFTGFYFVYPKYEKYQNQERSNEVLEQELENTISYLNELQVVNKKIIDKEESFNKLKTAFPEDHDVPSLYLYLMNTLENNNIRSEGALGGFSVTPYRSGNENHDRIKTISFSLSLKGQYKDIKNFLSETERLMRIIDINNFTISGRNDEKKDYVEIKFTAITYSY